MAVFVRSNLKKAIRLIMRCMSVLSRFLIRLPFLLWGFMQDNLPKYAWVPGAFYRFGDLFNPSLFMKRQRQEEQKKVVMIKDLFPHLVLAPAPSWILVGNSGSEKALSVQVTNQCESCTSSNWAKPIRKFRLKPNRMSRKVKLLSKPITKKDTSGKQNDCFEVGVSCMQGWRINMEDSHTIILSIPEDPGSAYFGVFDGHRGASISQCAGEYLHHYIVNHPEYKSGNIQKALELAFLDIDSSIRRDRSFRRGRAGCTANVVLIRGDKVYCANVGDSRAIAVVNGSVVPLSTDHKPYMISEHKRIKAAGGWVKANRVNGALALSRALGDYEYKRNYKKRPEEQIVTAFPDVVVKRLTSEWEFIVVACDGIWDVMTNEEVAEFVGLKLKSGMEPKLICEALMTNCLAPDLIGKYGFDNMTVIIIVLKHPKKTRN